MSTTTGTSGPATGSGELKVIFYYLAVDLEGLQERTPPCPALSLATFDGWHSNEQFAVRCAMAAAEIDEAIQGLLGLGVPEDLLFFGLEDGLDNLVLLHLEKKTEILQETPWLKLRRTEAGSWISRATSAPANPPPSSPHRTQ